MQCTLCTSALNMAVHFLEWCFHILITEGEPVCAEAKISVWPSNARAETCKILVKERESLARLHVGLGALNYHLPGFDNRGVAMLVKSPWDT